MCSCGWCDHIHEVRSLMRNFRHHMKSIISTRPQYITTLRVSPMSGSIHAFWLNRHWMRYQPPLRILLCSCLCVTGEIGIWHFWIVRWVLCCVQKISDDHSQWKCIGLHPVWLQQFSCWHSSLPCSCMLHLSILLNVIFFILLHLSTNICATIYHLH